jgi:chromosome partitioning protein
MTRVIAVYNQKGGVAKTTTCVNLSAYLALEGKRVLLIDFDPQANASSGVGHPAKLNEPSIYHGLFGLAEPEALIKPTIFYNYHLIPSSQHLAGALIELVNIPEREYKLKQFIDKIRDRYDYIFIDMPPSLSLLTINGLVAADEIVIPVQSHYFSMEGLSQLLEIIDLVHKNISTQGLKVAGAVMTMYDENEPLSHKIASDIVQNFPHNVFKTRIPRSSALSEAPSYGRPVILHDPNSTGARAYEQLAKELVAQETEKQFQVPSQSIPVSQYIPQQGVPPMQPLPNEADVLIDINTQPQHTPTQPVSEPVRQAQDMPVRQAQGIPTQQVQGEPDEPIHDEAFYF